MGSARPSSQGDLGYRGSESDPYSVLASAGPRERPPSLSVCPHTQEEERSLVLVQLWRTGGKASHGRLAPLMSPSEGAWEPQGDTRACWALLCSECVSPNSCVKA